MTKEEIEARYAETARIAAENRAHPTRNAAERIRDIAADADDWMAKIRDGLARSRAERERLEATPEFAAAKAAQEAAEDARQRRIEDMRVAETRSRALAMLPPPLRADLESGSFDSGMALPRAAKRWAESTVRVLVMRGGVGCGKSVAAAYACTLVSGSQWLRANGFISAVLHSYDESSPKLSRTLVVVDDVGQERDHSQLDHAMCEFLDMTATRLVVTTNLTPEAFAGLYSDRLVDRLGQYAVDISTGAKSLRRPASKTE